MLVSLWDGSVVGWLVKVPAICWCLSGTDLLLAGWLVKIPAICWCLSGTDLLLAGWLRSQQYVGVCLGRICCCWLVG